MGDSRSLLTESCFLVHEYVSQQDSTYLPVCCYRNLYYAYLVKIALKVIYIVIEY